MPSPSEKNGPNAAGNRERQLAAAKSSAETTLAGIERGKSALDRARVSSKAAMADRLKGNRTAQRTAQFRVGGGSRLKDDGMDDLFGGSDVQQLEKRAREIREKEAARKRQEEERARLRRAGEEA